MRFSGKAHWDLCGGQRVQSKWDIWEIWCSKTSLCCCRKITSSYIKCLCRTEHPRCDILLYFPHDSWINFSSLVCFWLTSGSRVLLWRAEPHSVPALLVVACATDEGPGWGSHTCHRWRHPQPAFPGAEWIPTVRGESWLVTTLYLDSCDCLVCGA